MGLVNTFGLTKTRFKRILRSIDTVILVIRYCYVVETKKKHRSISTEHSSAFACTKVLEPCEPLSFNKKKKDKFSQGSKRISFSVNAQLARVEPALTREAFKPNPYLNVTPQCDSPKVPAHPPCFTADRNVAWPHSTLTLSSPDCVVSRSASASPSLPPVTKSPP